MEQQQFAKQCQSCGMPLEDGKHAGTEVDGSSSVDYCKLCYTNGAFITPDMTLDEMKLVVDNALKEKGWWFPLRWAAKSQLKSLKRWQKA